MKYPIIGGWDNVKIEYVLGILYLKYKVEVLNSSYEKEMVVYLAAKEKYLKQKKSYDRRIKILELEAELERLKNEETCETLV